MIESISKFPQHHLKPQSSTNKCMYHVCLYYK